MNPDHFHLYIVILTGLVWIERSIRQYHDELGIGYRKPTLAALMGLLEAVVVVFMLGCFAAFGLSIILVVGSVLA